MTVKKQTLQNNSTIVALLVALPLIINSLGTFYTNKKADTIIRKTDEIHTLTNSNLSKISTELKVANEKILGLEKQIAILMEQQNSKKR